MPPYLRYKNRSLHGGVNQRAFEQDIGDVEAADLMNMDISVPGLRVKRKEPSNLFSMGSITFTELNVSQILCPNGQFTGTMILETVVAGTLQWVFNDNLFGDNGGSITMVFDGVEYNLQVAGSGAEMWQNVTSVSPGITYLWSVTGSVEISNTQLCYYDPCGDLVPSLSDATGCLATGPDPAGAGFVDNLRKAYAVLVRIV